MSVGTTCIRTCVRVYVSMYACMDLKYVRMYVCTSVSMHCVP